MKLQTQVGSRPVLQLAESLGLPHMPDVPSLALGVGEATPLQLTAAYAVFPNGGFAVAPRPIVQVLDNDGYAVLNREVERKPVLSEAVAFQMVSMLADVVDIGHRRCRSIARRALPCRRKDGHDRRLQGCVVRRLLIVDGRGRLGGIRSAGDDRPGRLRRAIRAADLGRFHVANRTRAQAGRISRADHGRSRSPLPRQPSRAPRDVPDLQRVLQARRHGPRGQVRHSPRPERGRGDRRYFLEDWQRDWENLRPVIPTEIQTRDQEIKESRESHYQIGDRLARYRFGCERRRIPVLRDMTLKFMIKPAGQSASFRYVTP